ncbi:hypothetical protein [Agrobacterium larrymoorei]|uniref:Uncharacterized protein n=1 Tax=Agrobacterium larrymoorei TaxID=160699 RepID=A0AAF0HA87_9HYPH|nr:hypothetical protein [Agrobacterium larrymoorei]WHA40950.1 hypothetical protein CFBP5477_014240 [Agrobacterium larrymoorei]
MAQVLRICFEKANKSEAGQVFGIADFLATVAIFVVAYSLSDAKYKFRNAVTRVSYRTILFYSTLVGGVALIVSNAVFALELPIPRALNNPLYFQIIIAAIFIGVIAYWMFKSFVRPPIFTKFNAVPFAQEVFRCIADGDQTELAACVNEVGRSARGLLREASRTETRRAIHAGGIEHYAPTSAKIASDILLLIGDRRFCRMVASRMPWVAVEIFRAAGELDGDVRRLAQFSRNVSDEFFADPESAIHHEDDGYYSGLIGYLKPVSSALYGNSKLIERLSDAGGSPLHLLWLRSDQWSIKSWKTYNEAVLLYLESKLKRGKGTYVATDLYQVFSGYRSLCRDLYLVNGMDDGEYYSSLAYQKFYEIVDFVREVLALLQKYNVTADPYPSMHDGHFFPDDIYDHLVDISLDLFSSAGSVDTPDFRNWVVQHNTLWSKLMAESDENYALDIYRKRLQRVLWSELSDLSRLPNFVSARILAVCLNVLGFRTDHDVHMPKRTRAFKRLILGWTKRNFLTLHSKYPSVAQSCIGGTITFDKDGGQLVKTYSSYFDKEPTREYLTLDPASGAVDSLGQQ